MKFKVDAVCHDRLEKGAWRSPLCVLKQIYCFVLRLCPSSDHADPARIEMTSLCLVLQPSASTMMASTWSCPLCTFLTEMTAGVCAMCDSPKPASASVTVAASPAAAGGPAPSDDSAYVTDDAAIEGIGEAPPLFDDAAALAASSAAGTNHCTSVRVFAWSA